MRGGTGGERGGAAAVAAGATAEAAEAPAASPLGRVAQVSAHPTQEDTFAFATESGGLLVWSLALTGGSDGRERVPWLLEVPVEVYMMEVQAGAESTGGNSSSNSSSSAASAANMSARGATKLHSTPLVRFLLIPLQLRFNCELPRFSKFECF